MTQADGSIDTKFLSQWGAVRLSALDNGIVLARSAELSANRATPAYVYEQDRVLVRDEDAADLLGRHLDGEPVPGRGVPGVGLYEIGERVPDAVARLNRIPSLKTDVATPNHLMSICPVQLCPADEPAPLAVTGSQEPFPARRYGTGGQGVAVDVLDTGLVDDFDIGHDWLTGITESQPCTPFGATGAIREYAGHGTFVTGVLRCAAPATTVRSMNAFRYAGATTEDQLANALLAALARKPHIISLSAGGSTLGGRPHAALEPFFARLQETRTLLVAAAGNEGGTDRFYPAAYAAAGTGAVVSVGALRYDRRGRACFSNFGDWVDVYALGERHVNAFMSGGYAYVDPQREDLTCRFHGGERLYAACTCVTMPPQGAVVAFRRMARWSGTSFATPLVAGLIATHMSDTGEMDAREAARQLRTTTRSITDTDGELLDALDHEPLLDWDPHL